MNEYDSLAPIVRINVFLLFSTACAATAYFIWPSSLKWWGFGLLAIILGAMAFQFVLKAIGLMRKLYRNKKVFQSYRTKRSNPKSARLTGDDDLRDAGML